VDVAGVISDPSLDPARARFEALVAVTEAPLRRALVAAYGSDAGREATADALAWAWEHLDRVETMTNPAGYLWRVGQTSARRGRRWSDRRSDVELPDLPATSDVTFEPALRRALVALTPHQRAAVLLVHGWGYTLEATADALACGVSSVRNHLSRGMAKLRATLGDADG
jgi:DNA-directed RNA polymerase specialized sigma24 family protein